MIRPVLVPTGYSIRKMSRGNSRGYFLGQTSDDGYTTLGESLRRVTFPFQQLGNPTCKLMAPEAHDGGRLSFSVELSEQPQ